MLKLAHQPVRKAFDGSARVSDQLRSHHDMPEQLAVIRIIILRKIRDFLQLSHIMESRSRQQQVPVQIGILPAVIVAEPYNAQRMLQQSAHKAVMNGFRGGMFLECLRKGFASEILVDQHLKPGIPHRSQEVHQFPVHFILVSGADGKIILRLVFAGFRHPHSLDIKLKVSLEACHISHNIDIIKGTEFIDPRRGRIPYLAVDRPCPVLENYILIVLSVLCHRALPLLAEIDVPDPVSLVKCLYEFHSVCLFLAASRNYSPFLSRTPDRMYTQHRR